jgi:outer membrane receptor protein involved in Fe transport
VDIPLLKQHAWAESLSLSSAIRHSEYDLFGGVNNYKLGLDWQVVTELKFHANYATAFRAPNVPELFAGNFNQNLNAVDPCNNWDKLPATSETYRNCQAQGVPNGFQQLAPSILSTLGGNTKLKPERAKTLTLGAIWEPTDKIQLSLDYFKIEIEDAIGSADGTTKLAACYASSGLSHPFCSNTQFTRNASTGQINFLSAQVANAASEQMSGIDLSAHYQFNLADWNAALNWDISYLRNYELVPFEGAEKVEYAGKITSGRGSYTQWRSLAELTLERGAWSGAYTIQYIGSAKDIAAPAGTIGEYAPSVSYHNIQAQYAFNDSLSLALGVDNLTDREAPFIRNWLDANTDTMTYDLLGRRWFIKSTYRW